MKTTPFNQIIQLGYPIVVAYSGGLDSTVLLKQLVELRKRQAFPLYAIHIHHGLSTHADAWLAHCKQTSEEWGVNFYHAHAHITQQNQQSLEAVARDARYRLITEIINQIAKEGAYNAVSLITGQHKDDQVETFFIRLKRGSGPKGLSAMANKRTVNDLITLYRPLLNTDRTALLTYAEQNQLQWVEDESNADDMFDRNFLRNNVLPIINKRWRGFKDCVVRSAELAAEYTQIVEEVASEDLTQIKVSANQLCCVRLSTLSDNRQRAVLRCWLQTLCSQLPSQKQLHAIQHEVIKAREDSQAQVKLKQGSLRKYQQKLYFCPLLDEIPVEVIKPIIWSSPLSSPLRNLVYNQIIYCEDALVCDPERSLMAVRAAHADEIVSIHYGVSGSVLCQPANRGRKRSIKKLLHEYKVPYWQRHLVPFLFYNDQLVAAIGLWPCSEFVTSSESSVLYSINPPI